MRYDSFGFANEKKKKQFVIVQFDSETFYYRIIIHASLFCTEEDRNTYVYFIPKMSYIINEKKILLLLRVYIILNLQLLNAQ